MRLPRALRISLPCVGLLLAGPARADIPAGYTGLPFDPAVEGGVGIIPATVKAGPYAIPGRIDFVNYDMGGSGVAFHAGDHILNKQGAGYRKGSDVATFSKTSMASKDAWYMTSTALDGTTYPDATTQDFYIGAVQVNDWFNYTVNVETTGMYAVSSTWSSGNGPPGGEGGDGAMGLQIYSNGTKLADWKSSWPDFNTTADFHHWKAYPAFTMVMLTAGKQVIKLQSTSKHLNLDYVEFRLAGVDSTTGAGGNGGGAGASGTGGSPPMNGIVGAAGVTGSAGGGAAGATGAAGSDATGTAGAGSTGTGGDGATAGMGGGNTGTAGAASGAGTAGSSGGVAGTGGAPKAKSSGGCAVTGAPGAGWLALLAAALGLAIARRRRA